jgi:hypothetical protein
MAMAAAAVSRSTASSTASGVGASGTDRTSRVARSHIAETASASSAPLGGAYDFEQHLIDAEQLLADGRNEEARRLFHQIHMQTLTPNFSLASLIRTHCLLGFAYSYPESKERTKHAADACTAINVVYANKHAWDPLNNEQKSSAYLALRSCFKRIKPLIPGNEVDAHQEIDAKIVECSKFILPLDAFHEMTKEADEYLGNDDLGNARDSYEAALASIDEKNGIEFLVGRAYCFLKLTGIYPNNSDIRARLRSTAQDVLFSLYDHRASLYETGQYTRVEAFKLLIGYLRHLHTLTLEGTERKAIQERIEACRPEIPEEASQIRTRRRASAPAAPSGPSGRGSAPPPESPPKKVRPNPSDRSCNLCRLIIACVFIAAIAVVGVALYRRHIVKVS